MNKSLALSTTLTVLSACQDTTSGKHIDSTSYLDQAAGIIEGVRGEIEAGKCTVDFNLWPIRELDENGQIACSDREDVYYGGYENPYFVSCPSGDYQLSESRNNAPVPTQISKYYPTDLDGFWLQANFCDPTQDNTRFFFEKKQQLLGIEVGDTSLRCDKTDEGVQCSLTDADSKDAFSMDSGDFDAAVNALDQGKNSLMAAARAARDVHDCNQGPSYGRSMCE